MPEMNALQMIWNVALTVGGAVGVFMLNRVANTLDNLQKADREMAKEISDLRGEYVPKSEFLIYGERLEKRLESYMALQMESNKTLFAKLDLLSEKLAVKIDRAECLQMMSDRRRPPSSDQ